MDAYKLRKHPRRHFDLGNLVWTLTTQGPLTVLRTTEIDARIPRPAKRGKCKGFSDAARLRMLKRVAVIDWANVKCGVFITLTWPCECWPRYEELRNQARDQFFRDLENYLGKKIYGLWRIEWKRRKKGVYRGKFLPHYHLIIPNIPFVDKRVIKQIWKRAVQAKGECISWIDSLADERKHAVYIAKYCSKNPASDVLDYVSYFNTPGRHWGQHRRKLLPVYPLKTFHDVPPETIAAIRRHVQSVRKGYDLAVDSGVSVFGKLGLKFALECNRIALDAGCRQE